MKSRCSPGQRQCRAMAVGFRAGDHPQENVVDVAVELGETGIGADRLLHLALRGGAIEARQVLLVGQRPSRSISSATS